MKVVFLGTPDFAIKPLKALLNSSHEVLSVITQPDKPVGRKGIITPSKVKQFATSKGVSVLTYENISKEGVEDLKRLNPDIMITCAYGQILSKEILDIAIDGKLPNFSIEKFKKFINYLSIDIKTYKQEINKMEAKIKKEGYTIIPLELFLSHGFAKIEIGLAKGKKLYDKREAIAKKTQDRDIARQIKR